MDEKRPRRVVRESALHDYDGLGKTQRKDAIDRGEYPAPIRARPSGRAKFWLLDEIIEWQEKRLAAGRILPRGADREGGGR